MGEKSGKKKHDGKKPKRKKPAPKLTIINANGEEVECLLETAKHSTITFKFNPNDDQPEDIADNLVRFISWFY